MKYRFSCSLEHDTAPVLTHRGKIEASTPRPAIARAFAETQKVFRGKHWTSVVVVLEKV